MRFAALRVASGGGRSLRPRTVEADRPAERCVNSCSRIPQRHWSRLAARRLSKNANNIPATLGLVCIRQYDSWCNISVDVVGAGMSGVKVRRHFSIEMWCAEAGASVAESSRTACKSSSVFSADSRPERSQQGGAPPSAANVYASWACSSPRDRVVSQPTPILSPSPATDDLRLSMARQVPSSSGGLLTHTNKVSPITYRANDSRLIFAPIHGRLCQVRPSSPRVRPAKLTSPSRQPVLPSCTSTGQ